MSRTHLPLSAAGSDTLPDVAGGRKRSSGAALHALWLSVFAFQALAMHEDPAARISTAGFAVLFTVLVVTELRSGSRDQH